jgi:hypothetical protein
MKEIPGTPPIISNIEASLKMDIIIDTNIIKKENFLRSKKFTTLIDYLRKTKSRIILPQIVKEESISLYKKDVSSALTVTKNKIEELSRTCHNPVEIDLDIDIAKEVDSYIAHIQELSDKKLLYEIPYYNDFLPEIVHRMINRKKPCSQKGEEFRDVILWLNVKKLLKEKKSVAFISNNTNEFASSKDNPDLHPDLRAELIEENLELKYYLDINDFLKKHAERIDYITEQWVNEKLSKIDLNSLIEHYFIVNDSFLIRRAEWKKENSCIDAFPTILSVDLDDFYVYEMTNGEIYLNLILYLDLEIEAEFEDIGTQLFYEDTYVELSVKVINRELTELEVNEIYK